MFLCTTLYCDTLWAKKTNETQEKHHKHKRRITFLVNSKDISEQGTVVCVSVCVCVEFRFVARCNTNNVESMYYDY